MNCWREKERNYIELHWINCSIELLRIFFLKNDSLVSSVTLCLSNESNCEWKYQKYSFVITFIIPNFIRKFVFCFHPLLYLDRVPLPNFPNHIIILKFKSLTLNAILADEWIIVDLFRCWSNKWMMHFEFWHHLYIQK